MSKLRLAVGAITLSAAAFVGLTAHEGYTDRAVIPVPGDVPTIGFGSTENVKMGDTITVPKALHRALADASKFEGALKQCVKVPLHQHEYDAAVQLAYNIGPNAFCNSTVVRRFNAGDYAGACDAFLMWNQFKGKTLNGLQKRREAERRLCLGIPPLDHAQGAEKVAVPVSKVVAVPDHLVWQAMSFGPIGEIQGLALVLVHDTGSAISDLIFPGGPSTVVGTVIPVVVDSLNGPPFRGFAHISQETVEIAPALTNANSSAAVFGIGGGVGIAAALAHAAPDVVNPLARLAMPKHGVRLLGLNAAAGLLTTVGDVVAEGLHGAPAVALKEPPGLSVAWLVLDAANRDQPVEPLSSEIAEFHGSTRYHKGAP